MMNSALLSCRTKPPWTRWPAERLQRIRISKNSKPEEDGRRFFSSAAAAAVSSFKLGSNDIYQRPLLSETRHPGDSYITRSCDILRNASQPLHSRFYSAPSINKDDAENLLLSVQPDRWRGIGLDSSIHFRHFTVDEFRHRLSSALRHWQSTGIRPITVKIHEADSAFIPVAIEAGFQFHHAQPGYVYLKKWIADDEPDTFPAYANHYLGVAGFVVDRETDEMLVIKERFAPKPMWKLPGGTADSGEDLHQIACREVKEETGVDTEFVGVVCFRHMHNFRYGCSDFYFVCHLRPLTKEIKIDESEIADCRWMKVDEYLENQAPTAMNKHFVQCYKDYLNQEKFRGVIGKKAVHHHINKVDYNVYSIFGSDLEQT